MLRAIVIALLLAGCSAANQPPTQQYQQDEGLSRYCRVHPGVGVCP